MDQLVDNHLSWVSGRGEGKGILMSEHDHGSKVATLNQRVQIKAFACLLD